MLTLGHSPQRCWHKYCERYIPERGDLWLALVLGLMPSLLILIQEWFNLLRICILLTQQFSSKCFMFPTPDLKKNHQLYNDGKSQGKVIQLQWKSSLSKDNTKKSIFLAENLNF